MVLSFLKSKSTPSEKNRSLISSLSFKTKPAFIQTCYAVKGLFICSWSPIWPLHVNELYREVLRLQIDVHFEVLAAH